jgi:predicted XRE-type DNA-binding protein
MRGRVAKQEIRRRDSIDLRAGLGCRTPENMLLKERLISRIAELLTERGMTQTQAATTLGIPQPNLSKMLRGQFRPFSEWKLMCCLLRLGQDVHIVIRPRKDQRRRGTISVTFA